VDQDIEVAVRHRDGSTIVAARGEIDVATAPVLRTGLDQALARDIGAVVVDLTGVTFIDSTGLGVLIGARRRCAEAGRDLRVVVDEPRILKVFEITGLTELFAIHASLEPALEV
jgi:anti-sigma B factor antagonist